MKPPQEAVDHQSLTAFWLFNHLKREGVKAADEVVIVPGGAWTAEGGPLRPGLEELWQHLVDYGVRAIIANDVYAAAPRLPPVSALHLDHPLTRTLFARFAGPTPRGATLARPSPSRSSAPW